MHGCVHTRACNFPTRGMLESRDMACPKYILHSITTPPAYNLLSFRNTGTAELAHMAVLLIA